MQRLPSPNFSIKDASKELGLKPSSLRYYLEDGFLRYGVRIDNPYLQVVYDHTLMSLLKDYEGTWPPSESHLTTSLVEPLKDRFLYIRSDWLTLCSKSKNKKELLSCEFETFEGKTVITVMEEKQIGKYFYATCGFSVEDPIITEEELERFRGILLSGGNAGKASTDPYQVPDGTDPCADAIVSYANLFVKKNKKIPKHDELFNFMLEGGLRGYVINHNSEKQKKPYHIEGTDLSERSFIRRLRDYRKIA